MSSPALSTTSTPLYRVFRGLKSTQVIATPANEREWRVTLNEFKAIYLEGKWKECESKCSRLLEASKGKPVIYPYVLFLIGSCVEIHARNMHQYSAGKGKKMEEAATWFEKCEKALPHSIKLPDEHNVPNNALRTPPMSPKSGRLSVTDINKSPPTAFGAKSRFDPTPNRHEERENERQLGVDHHKKESPGGLVSSITKMIDRTLELPFDETDPFLSLTPEAASLGARIGNWLIPPVPRLTPSPLRICKVKSDNILGESASKPFHFTTAPSLQSQDGHANGISHFSIENQTPDLEVRPLKKRTNFTSYDSVFFENSIHRSDCRYTGFVDDDGNSESTIKYKTWDEHIKWEIETSQGDGKFLIDETNAYSPSAKPSPLRIKPKRMILKPVDAFNSDQFSLGRLQRFWEISSFNGIIAKNSDAQSLSAVEPTWAYLSAQYRAALSAEDECVQALKTHVTNYNNHLASLSAYLQRNVSRLRQLATTIDFNRTSHIEARRIQPTKSYWSFSVKSNSGDFNGNDDYDEHRDKPEMKANLGWAAPGTILNETKKERVKRLKAERFRNVGMQNEKRGHKGRSWYLDLCGEILDDIEGLMRGVY
ncbi:hypothetical protein BGW36DRAFT_456707 [Talaromyces proteolyticus]|uniref:Uncharacterized protein n=1 Tax=Talaromyces proteolyticus TaxID=1131652 RepID=A0AAD4L3F6_9EURO|nr:uncharacterized protein BGW36DRAFT_456707 [Talaromyces proteolyticus]KAH8705203.1 hypothetical protein BGW36DRAFT_456707 [Talaromyces proteolyticus]